MFWRNVPIALYFRAFTSMHMPPPLPLLFLPRTLSHLSFFLSHSLLPPSLPLSFFPVGLFHVSLLLSLSYCNNSTSLSRYLPRYLIRSPSNFFLESSLSRRNPRMFPGQLFASLLALSLFPTSHSQAAMNILFGRLWVTNFRLVFSADEETDSKVPSLSPRLFIYLPITSFIPPLT